MLVINVEDPEDGAQVDCDNNGVSMYIQKYIQQQTGFNSYLKTQFPIQKSLATLILIPTA